MDGIADALIDTTDDLSFHFNLNCVLSLTHHFFIGLPKE